MRRIIAALLALVLLGSLMGCGASSSDTKEIVGYYRQAKTDFKNKTGIVAAEPCRWYKDTMTVEAFLEQYFKGPESNELISPFPQEVRLKSYHNENGISTITLDGGYDRLDGISKSIACACLTKTLLQFPEIESVTVREAGSLTTSPDSRRLSDSSFVLFDEETETQQTDVKIYFPDLDNRYLLVSTMRIMSDSNETTAMAVMQQLIVGPPATSMRAIMPTGSMLRGLTIDSGICTVDFNLAFLVAKPQTAQEERMLIFSIVNSLCAISGVDGVRFRCEGERIGKYVAMNLDQVLTGSDASIGPVRTAIGEIDGTVYMTMPDGGHLSAFAARINPSANESEEAALLRTMQEFEPAGGYSNPVPKNAQLNSCTIDDVGVCHVDYSKELYTGLTATERLLCTRAVIATLCQTDQVRMVDLTIDGSAEKVLPYVDTMPTTADDSWMDANK